MNYNKVNRMSKYICKVFGRNLFTMRKEKGLTQLEIAVELDIDASTIGKYENGTRCPNLRTASRIAKIMGVKLSKMVD